MINQPVGQILGIISAILTLLSYQMKVKKKIMLFQTIATAFTCISFLFLGAISGFALNIVCLVRNGVFSIVDTKKQYSRWLGALFSVIMVVFGVISYQYWFSLLITVALVGNSIFISLDSPQTLRKSILFTSSLVLIYNAIVFSIGGMVNEGVSIVSSAIGLWRYRKTKNVKN